ncbi:hypothetical protein FCV25MIE_25168 [Fagus crenata]
MIHHLKELYCLRGTFDTSNNIVTPCAEVDDRNCELGIFAWDWITGENLLWQVDENSWEFGDRSIHKAFDAGF